LKLNQLILYLLIGGDVQVIQKNCW